MRRIRERLEPACRMKGCESRSDADGLCIQLSAPAIAAIYRTYSLGNLFQTTAHEILEFSGPAFPRIQSRRRSLGNMKYDLHGMFICVRGFSLCELECGDTEGPDIRLCVVA
jgi:hypothetical protein